MNAEGGSCSIWGPLPTSALPLPTSLVPCCAGLGRVEPRINCAAAHVGAKRFSMKAILHGCRWLMVSCKVLCWHTYLRG